MIRKSYKKLKSLGDIADEHWKLELLKRALEEDIRTIKADQDRYEMDAIELSEEQGNLICRGKHANGQIETKEHFNIAERNKLDKWILKSGRTEILQGRVSSTVFRELRDLGESIPGISIFNKKEFRTKKRTDKKR